MANENAFLILVDILVALLEVKLPGRPGPPFPRNVVMGPNKDTIFSGAAHVASIRNSASPTARKNSDSGPLSFPLGQVTRPV